MTDGVNLFDCRYVYNTSLEEYDWFLKADDDTYVIMENLRLLLTNYSSNKEVYLGCHFKEFLAEGLVPIFSPLRNTYPMILVVLTFSGYASGGAGYVLSRKAVRRFVEDGLNKNVCRSDSGGFEDVEIGTCLVKIGITIQDTRDSYGRARFFPFNATWHMRPSDVKRKDVSTIAPGTFGKVLDRFPQWRMALAIYMANLRHLGKLAGSFSKWRTFSINNNGSMRHLVNDPALIIF